MQTFDTFMMAILLTVGYEAQLERFLKDNPFKAPEQGLSRVEWLHANRYSTAKVRVATVLENAASFLAHRRGGVPGRRSGPFLDWQDTQRLYKAYEGIFNPVWGLDR